METSNYCVGCQCGCAKNDEPVVETRIGPLCQSCITFEWFRCNSCGAIIDSPVLLLDDMWSCPECRTPDDYSLVWEGVAELEDGEAKSGE
jgi:hypothetical protein